VLDKAADTYFTPYAGVHDSELPSGVGASNDAAPFSAAVVETLVARLGERSVVQLAALDAVDATLRDVAAALLRSPAALVIRFDARRSLADIGTVLVCYSLLLLIVWCCYCFIYMFDLFCFGDGCLIVENLTIECGATPVISYCSNCNRTHQRRIADAQYRSAGGRLGGRRGAIARAACARQRHESRRTGAARHFRRRHGAAHYVRHHLLCAAQLLSAADARRVSQPAQERQIEAQLNIV
jgi:hypothetical protein